MRVIFTLNICANSSVQVDPRTLQHRVKLGAPRSLHYADRCAPSLTTDAFGSGRRKRRTSDAVCRAASDRFDHHLTRWRMVERDEKASRCGRLMPLVYGREAQCVQMEFYVVISLLNIKKVLVRNRRNVKSVKCLNRKT